MPPPINTCNMINILILRPVELVLMKISIVKNNISLMGDYIDKIHNKNAP